MSAVRNRLQDLKDPINQLFCIEGKSLNYISTLFDIPRKLLASTVKGEWGFEKGQKRNASPKTRKLISVHKERIITFCKNTDERSLSTLLKEIGVTRSEMKTIRLNDSEIDTAVSEFTSKESLRDIAKTKRLEREANWNLDINSIPGEVWVDVKGYEGRYFVSNKSRIKSVNKVLTPNYNKRTGRYEIVLYDENGHSKNHKVYRIVAHAFVENPNNWDTVNHRDGNTTNDSVDNLEWSTQKYQNWYRLHILNRNVAKAYGKNGKFKLVKVDDYSFKTLKAAAKFLGVSEGMIQRYVSGECKCDRKIELIY